MNITELQQFCRFMTCTLAQCTISAYTPRRAAAAGK